MTSRMAGRLSVLAIGATMCAAITLWLSFGALTFVDAAPDASRVGLLPPLSWLAMLLVVALALAIVLRPRARDVAPLWLSLFLILPWLPVSLPVSAFIWTGVVRWWVWLAIAAAIIVPIVGRRLRVMDLVALEPSRAALAAGGIAALAYGLGAWNVSPQYPAGDEPHYLIITQSLIKDHDLQIENNHREGDYLVYHNAPLKPDYLKRGVNGQIYSIHAPGLPFLVAPMFALSGYVGVRTALLLLAAAATGLAWWVAWLVTRDTSAAWFAWAAIAFSTPFFFHAFAVYPDPVAAVILLIGMLPVVDERWREPSRLLVVGAALALLPWLHTRLAIAAAAAAIVIVGRLVTGPRVSKRLVALLACPLVSAVAWFAFFQLIYGTPNPAAPYGGAKQSDVAYFVRGIPGLLIDQQFGLLPNAPVYFCALAGLVVMLWQGPRRLLIELLIIGVPYDLSVAAFQMWWAGYSAPARFLVPTTLVLAIPTAIWFASCRGTIARLVSATTLLLSLSLTATLVATERGIAIFNVRDGASELLLRLSPLVNLSTAHPTLFRGTPSSAVVHALIWCAAAAVGVVVGLALERRGWTAGPIVLVVAALWGVGAMAATSLVWRQNAALAITPQNGALAVIRRYDPATAQLALSLDPLHRIRLADLPRSITIAAARPSTVSPGFPLVFLTHAPAAVYELEGTVTGRPAGRLRVAVDRQSPPLQEWDVASFDRLWSRRITVPTAVSTLRVDVDAAARTSISRLSVRAIEVPRSHERIGGALEAARGARYGPDVIFLMGGDAYVEGNGIWISGGQTSRFVVSPDPDAPIRLLVRNTAAANHVTFASGAWRQEMVLQSREERLVDVPHDPHALGTLLTVTSAAGARPIDFEANSTDDRFLGCWIETR